MGEGSGLGEASGVGEATADGEGDGASDERGEEGCLSIAVVATNAIQPGIIRAIARETQSIHRWVAGGVLKRVFGMAEKLRT